MSRCTRALRAAVCLLFIVAGPLFAIQPVAVDPALPKPPMPALQVSGPDLQVGVSLLLGSQRDGAIESRSAGFKRQFGHDWEIRWDSRGDRPNLVQGSGVPLVPGRGNALTPAQFGVASAEALDIDTVSRAARRFVDGEADLLKLDGIQLRLDPERSIVYRKDRSFWSIEFAQYHEGVRVDDAFVFVRVSQGNVIQFGSERVGNVRVDSRPALDRDQAFQLAWRELDFPPDARIAETIEPGELRYFPVAPAGESAANGFSGARGTGYEHVLAWRYVFRVTGNPATWQVLFDAHTNRVIDVRDLDDYIDATVSGGVYPTTNTDPETVIPFPFVSVSNGGTKVTDTLGIYDYSSGTATTALNGKYFQIVDTCGSISLSNTTDGNLAFGAGTGTNCSVPTGNSAGAGNTHASRTGFYHLSRINEKARGILTGNAWLQTKVTANMNLNQVCNAYWDGNAVNFFKSGSGCSNTGEIAAVFLHEWGHGLDQNTGGSANEYGSGEAVGDTFAFLETRDSCIGENFTPGSVCHNCTTCTGVRDVNDFGLDGTRPIARPSNVIVPGGIKCNDYAGLNGISCPYNRPDTGTAYRGPMGYEGHCESIIASSANWDLKNALVARFGDSGWDRMDDIWYGSLTPSKSAYQVASGGTCNPAATVNGCAATNWFSVYLAADDDDGNLANGTPNACRIWDAFDAHGIACGTRPVCSADGADFALTVGNDPQTVCAPANGAFTIAVAAQGGFSNPVTLSASGQPAGSSIGFAPNPVSPGAASTMTVSGTGSVAAGSYTITVTGAANASPGHSVDAHLTINDGAPAAPALSTPANGAAGVDTGSAFAWQAVAGAASYEIQIATDSAFTGVVVSQTGLPQPTYVANGLAPATLYFWRVRAVGGCGQGAYSTPFSFTTANLVCRNPALAIPDNNPTGVTDTLAFADATVLSGLRLKIGATHTYVGDLRFTLKRGGTSVIVLNPSNCGTDNIEVLLDDASTTPVQTQCNASPPAISGIDQPASPLDAPFAGQAFGGTWTLTVVDTAGQDVGTLDQWCLEPKTSGAPTYTVGGTVTGLSGSGLALSLNGGTSLPISGNGTFAFPSALAGGASYVVAVATQPGSPAQTCTVSNGTGIIGTANVTDVDVTCATAALYTVGGTVSGLAGSGLVLSLNGGSSLAIPADGAFTFPVTLAGGAAFEVTVATQPAGPIQTCSIANGSGTIEAANVTDVEVTCATATYTVGGTVSGLSGGAIALSLNGGASLEVSTNGGFTFPAPLIDGSAYTVTIAAQPAGQTCSVGHASGTIAGANVGNVVVACSVDSYTIGGTVSGLIGSGLSISLNGGTGLTIADNGSFVFPLSVAAGAAYAVTVIAQPDNPAQACSVSNGSGVVGSANVTNVDVTCSDRIFGNGFEAGP